MNVRTRFAPSPTGFMHIGNLRTALYAYLFARKNKGKFILRIEDTDQKREVAGAVDVIYDILKITGLSHDEGPDIGGEFGPYIQSQRKEIYKKYAKDLIDLGGAYYCFCKKERLEALKEVQKAQDLPLKYDGHCRDLSKEEVTKKLEAGESFVIRQKISNGITTYHDWVYGDISINNSELDDNVLLKSDGLPTYNFANVIDDHLMQISHVIRGAEYVSSTPKYILIYNAFGWQIPEHIHLSSIVRPGGKKLSKRAGDAYFTDFLEKGYLPEAIINYIAFLGWGTKDDREIFTLKELEEVFDANNLHKSPAVFDIEKLKWYNSVYLRQMPLEKFNEMAMPYYSHLKNIDFLKLSALLKERIEFFSEIPGKIDFFEKLPEYDTNLFKNDKMKVDLTMSKEVLEKLSDSLASLDDWSLDSLKEFILAEITSMKLKNGQVLWPLRIALSGKEFTPGGAFEIAEILGKAESLARIDVAKQKLS